MIYTYVFLLLQMFNGQSQYMAAGQVPSIPAATAGQVSLPPPGSLPPPPGSLPPPGQGMPPQTYSQHPATNSVTTASTGSNVPQR